MTVTLLLAVFLILIATIGLGVRILFVKNGEMRGTCASQNPALNQEGESCSFCGKPAGETCGKEEK